MRYYPPFQRRDPAGTPATAQARSLRLNSCAHTIQIPDLDRLKAALNELAAAELSPKLAARRFGNRPVRRKHQRPYLHAMVLRDRVLDCGNGRLRPILETL